MLEPMVKVHLLGHRRHLDAALALLHRLQVLQIIDVTDDPTVPLAPFALDEGRLEEVESLRYLRTRLESLLRLLPAPPAEPDRPVRVDLDRVRRDLDALTPSIEESVRHLDALVNEFETLPRYLESLRRLLPLVPELTDLHRYETAALLIDRRYGEVLRELGAELTQSLGGNFEIISGNVDDTTIGAVLVFPRTESDLVQATLGREQLSRVRLPHRFTGMPFREAIAAMTRRLDELPAEIDVARTAIAAMVEPRGEWIVAVRSIDERLERLEAVRHLGVTTHTFALSGWVPESDLATLEAAVAHDLGNEVVLVGAPPTDHDEPPVLMRNRGPARWFEPLVRLLDVPRPGSIDPTWLMALFLPLFFGIMLGDVVYGVALAAIGVWLGRRFGPRSATIADVGKVMVVFAGWTIVWGVVYGEYLGDLGRRLLGIEPVWIDREEALVPLLLFSLAIGVGHVSLGVVLGIWCSARSGKHRELTERVALLVAMTGLFAVTGIIAGLIPDGAMTPAVAGVIVGLVVMMWAGGGMGLLLGPLDLLGTIGNVLSYLRIAAIGLASVYLARVANELGAAAPLLIGLIVATLFHTLNLALGAFSPTIQSLRLHYVEFFSKFYEPGGKEFNPFGDSDVITGP